MIFLIPEADGGDLAGIGQGERDQIQKSFLAAQPGKDFMLYQIGKSIEKSWVSGALTPCEQTYRPPHCEDGCLRGAHPHDIPRS